VLDRAWRLAAGAAAAVVGSVTELAELAGAVCSGATSAIGLVRASVEEVANPIVPTLAAGTGVSAAAGSSSRVHVRRSRADSALRADQLVEGDVIRLQAGDAVPADCRVLSGRDLEIDESTLTGESVPVAKSARATGARALADRNSMLYEGTVVAAGSGGAVVVATGTARRRPHPAPRQRRGARDRGRDPDRKLTAQIPTTTRCGSGTPGLSLSPPSTCWDRFRPLG
jgi:magnesium-transporting ATPase (P-type)